LETEAEKVEVESLGDKWGAVFFLVEEPILG
jgi:hypothetical protein